MAASEKNINLYVDLNDTMFPLYRIGFYNVLKMMMETEFGIQRYMKWGISISFHKYASSVWFSVCEMTMLLLLNRHEGKIFQSKSKTCVNVFTSLSWSNPKSWGSSFGLLCGRFWDGGWNELANYFVSFLLFFHN